MLYFAYVLTILYGGTMLCATVIGLSDPPELP